MWSNTKERKMFKPKKNKNFFYGIGNLTLC